MKNQQDPEERKRLETCPFTFHAKELLEDPPLPGGSYRVEWSAARCRLSSCALYVEPEASCAIKVLALSQIFNEQLS